MGIRLRCNFKRGHRNGDALVDESIFGLRLVRGNWLKKGGGGKRRSNVVMGKTKKYCNDMSLSAKGGVKVCKGLMHTLLDCMADGEQR